MLTHTVAKMVALLWFTMVSIENYQDLKDELAANGHTFKSETDTEILAHLIESLYEDDLKKLYPKLLLKLKVLTG